MPVPTEAADTESPGRRTIGALLRETRQGVGGDIDLIAATLRIRAVYLRAIEESRYDHLPAPVYALGFVRAYANYLGLDGEEAVRRFKHETVDFEPPRGLSFPMPLAERSIPGGTMVLAAVILALCGYGLWYYVSTGERARPERVSAVPAALAPPAAVPAVPASPPHAPTASTPVTPAPAIPPLPAAPPPVASAPLPPPAVPAAPPAAPPAASPAAAPQAAAPPAAPAPSPAVPASAPSAATAPAAAAASGTPANAPAATPTPAKPAADEARVFGAVGEPSRIVINVTQDCWIQIRDGDRIMIDKLLHPGESYRVGERTGLVMDVGNAVGLAIEVDGHKTPPIKGTVRHDIALDAARLVAGTAVPK
jgi:cytoskeletal protein RodZ